MNNTKFYDWIPSVMLGFLLKNLKETLTRFTALPLPFCFFTHFQAMLVRIQGDATGSLAGRTLGRSLPNVHSDPVRSLVTST